MISFRNLRAMLTLGLVVFSLGTSAQGGVSFFATDPTGFLTDFTNMLNQSKQEQGRAAAETFTSLWNSGKVLPTEQDAFISLANLMAAKRYKAVPDFSGLVQAFDKVKSINSYVQLDPAAFLDVSRSCVINLEAPRVSRYFAALAEYVPSGYPIQRTKYTWFASQTNPKLLYITLKDATGTYAVPVIRFTQTDLIYTRIGKDSTHIYRTAGDFNLMALSFIGEGGRVSWEKVGLNPEDVYADFERYQLNFNHGLVRCDTVTFFYKTLIKEPLQGMYEDYNLGFRDPNTANYPYFKSHEGGVVIENFIPNVRYEGGFSLMGTRKIGSAYDIWVEEDLEEETGAGDGWYSDVSTTDLKAEETKATATPSEWDFEISETAIPEPVPSSDPEIDFVPFVSAYVPTLYQQHIPAKMELYRLGKVVMKLEGEAFILDQDKMVGANMEAAVYTSGQDSIYHPSMDVLYTTRDSTVILKKPKRGTYKSIPFTSSYHEYFLYFETIIWDLRTDKLEFTAFVDRENKVSAIESFDYYTKARFDQFKGMLPFNPIGAIYRYEIEHPDEPIFPQSILKEYKLPADQLTTFERTLPALEGSGFITYNPKSLEIKTLPKLVSWARAARNKKDFDAIQIISKVDTGSHATMSLEDMRIDMRGVNYFSLSDSVYVRAVPINAKVTVLNNRSLQFGGAVAAGKLNFYASDSTRPNFSFDYESYRIVCDSLDSIRFVLVRNPPPGYQPTPLERALGNTVFEGVTGAIYIDDPNNKSGEKDYPFYPVFDSYSNSYLYWNKPDIEGGVYTKEQLNFAVDPFVLDSLEDFDGTNLQFDGELFSSEIFPRFRQKLEVMPDFTLGLRKETPPGGYSIYNGNGRFYDDIILDSHGLRGDGRLEYLGTEARSDSFVFHFDSVMANVNYFNLRRGYRGGVYFPQVDANTALYKWFTKDSALQVSSTYESLSLFGGEGKFTGVLSITEKGMVGRGEVVMGQVKIRGDSIVFKDMEFTTDQSDFILVDQNDTSLTHFVARGVKVKYDVYRHTSSFEAMDTSLQAVFPKHQYATSFGKGNYSRATNDLKLDNAAGRTAKNYFVSTDPKQDNLRFVGEKAYYKLDTREIEVSGVPYIAVADAVIKAQDKKAIIKDDGLIKPLANVTIEINNARDTSIYHRIYDGTATIFSRNEYQGTGKYDYIEINRKKQYIPFSNIEVNSDTITIASGTIEESQGFYLTERILFRGTTRLDASQKFLTFEGEVKIESENEVFKGAWFTFDKAVVNPDSVFIPIASDLTNDAGEILTVGLNYVEENREFYSNFLQAKEDDEDLSILSASGGLTFDRKKKEFKIGSEAKLKSQVYKGSTVSFNDSSNIITSQGFLKFPYDFPDKTISIKMAGAWKASPRALSTDLIMGINMEVIPAEQLTKVGQGLSFTLAGSKDIDFKQRSFRESISELLDENNRDERETQRFITNAEEALIYSDVKLAQQLPFTLLLSGVNFNYDRTTKALYCDSDVGLIGLNGTPINKNIGSKIVYQFGRVNGEGEKEPDQLTILLEVDEFTWIYFKFEDGVVRTVSSLYEDYNYPLQAIIDKRKVNEGYRFEMATEDDKTRFQQDFIKKYIR